MSEAMTHTQQKDATVEAVALAIYEREVVTGQPTWDGLDYGRKGYHIKTAQAAISAFKESEEWKSREGLIRNVEEICDILVPHFKVMFTDKVRSDDTKGAKIIDKIIVRLNVFKSKAKQMGFGE